MTFLSKAFCFLLAQSSSNAAIQSAHKKLLNHYSGVQERIYHVMDDNKIITLLQDDETSSWWCENCLGISARLTSTVRGTF
jgi:hypothetical protein